MAKRKPIDRAPDVHPFHAPVDSTFDIVNRYGTYNIQPTADTENLFPLIAPGLPVFDIVGMAGAGTPARESRERVRVALHSLGIRMPASRITVSFSPADIPKRGFVPDLPVAIGILICLGHLRQEDLADTLISGELGLSGEVRTVRRGTMLLAEAAAEAADDALRVYLGAAIACDPTNDCNYCGHKTECAMPHD